MPSYEVVYSMEDAYGRPTTKTFQSVDTLADETAALAAAAGLATDLANLTEAVILSYSVKQRVPYTDSVDPGANKDEGVTFSIRKVDNFKDVIKVPAPINAIFNADGTVDLTNAAVTAFISNFLVGGDFTFSDGEQGSALLSGKLDE